MKTDVELLSLHSQRPGQQQLTVEPRIVHLIDAYYLKAQKVRTLIRQDFQKAFETCDALITPVAPTTAFKIGEKITNPLDMYLSDVFVSP